ncbi:serine/threonine protein kinase [Aliikangiella sp. IMCC44359]|uniref:serine/threonine protein kinase n=1 Tax=Aliikangiella sp. IMCC44359 TaxID=3459125 RepID=UPI00403AAE26
MQNDQQQNDSQNLHSHQSKGESEEVAHVDKKQIDEKPKIGQAEEKIVSTESELTEHRSDSQLAELKNNAIDSFEGTEKADQEEALTQIGKVLQAQRNKKGFLKAQQDTDKALAENKIILNHRFVLESTLGSGGMGTVYKAQDLRKVEARDTNPYVATKVLNSDFRNHPDAFISLQREASRSHILSHPNIVTVHDFDRDGNTIFMTMELLEGEDLDSLLKRHKGVGLPKEKAIGILRDFCQALDFAHEKGIIHSDLKPANIFVTKQQAKVLDFGIARLAAESQYQDHFDAGEIGALTPAYASLEMLGNQPPDASDDIYAAAIIAYEMLSGAHPYKRKSAATAHAMELKPKRIPGLSNREWKALSSALSLRRAERTQSIKTFMEGLTVKPKFPLFRVSSLLLLTTLCWFAYTQYFSPNELNVFTEQALAKAKQCFKQQDYLCEIDSANDILKVAPEHTEAKIIVQRAEKDYAEQIKIASIQKSLSQAEGCFEQQNFHCVIENTTQILEKDASHQQAILLAQKAQEAINNERTKQASIEKAFSNNMTLATNCFKKKNYACSIKYTQLALKNKPGEITAKSLYENANYAYQQQQDNLKKAKKILQEGLWCFKKLDYSCAIAKSESALEFVPGYQQALKLKREAVKSMASVKGTIEIQ